MVNLRRNAAVSQGAGQRWIEGVSGQVAAVGDRRDGLTEQQFLDWSNDHHCKPPVAAMFVRI